MGDKQQVQDPPVQKPAPAPVQKPADPPPAENSVIQDQLKAQPDVVKVTDPATSVGPGYAAQTSNLPSLGKVTKVGDADRDRQEGTTIGHKDPTGKHIVRTDEKVRRLTEPAIKFDVDPVTGKKKLAGTAPGTSERKTNSQSIGLSGPNLTGGFSSRTEEFTGVNGAGDKELQPNRASESQGGFTYNGKDGLALNGGHSVENTTVVTNEDGSQSTKTRTGSGNIQINSQSTQLTGAVGNGSTTGAATAGMSHDGDTMNFGLSGSQKVGKNSGFALGAGVSIDRDRAEQNRVEGKDGYGTALDVMNRPTESNPDGGNADHLYANKRDYGWGVSANLGIQAGVVGVSASGYFSKSNSISYNMSGETAVQHKGKPTTLDALYKTDKAAAESYIAEHDKMTQKGGETINRIGDLPVAAMKPGTSYSLEQSTAFGGGGGVSVYGIGGSGSYDRAQMQRTNIVKDKDGGVTVDIEVADQSKAEGNVDAPGLQIGGGADWGNSSQVRFRFDGSDQGQAQLAEFQKTGVLPGAMTKEDPAFERYTKLAGQKDLSKKDRADLAEMADRVNAGQMDKMAGLKRGGQPSDVGGVKYEGGRKGKHKEVKGHVKGLGFTLGDFGTRNATATHWNRDPDGTLQYGQSGRRDDNNFLSRNEFASGITNDPSRIDTRLSAEVNDTEKGKHIIRLSQDRVPGDIQSGIFYSQTGNGYDDYTQFNFTTYDGDAQNFGKAMENVDLSTMTQPYRDKVETEESFRERLNTPLSDREVADKVTHNQAMDEAGKWLSAYRSGDADAMEGMPANVRELIDKNQKTLTQNARDDFTRFEQFERERRNNPLGLNRFADPRMNQLLGGGNGRFGLPGGGGALDGMKMLDFNGQGNGLQSFPIQPGGQSVRPLNRPLFGDQSQPGGNPLAPQTSFNINPDGTVSVDQRDPFDTMMDVRTNNGAAQQMHGMLSNQLADQAKAARGNMSDKAFLEGQTLDSVTGATAQIRDQQVGELRQNMAGPLAHQASKIMLGSHYTAANPKLMVDMMRGQKDTDNRLMLALPLTGAGKTDRAETIGSMVFNHKGQADTDRFIRFMEAMNRVGNKPGMDQSFNRLLDSRASGTYK